MCGRSWAFFSTLLFLARQKSPYWEKSLSPTPGWKSIELSPGWEIGQTYFLSSSLTASNKPLPCARLSLFSSAHDALRKIFRNELFTSLASVYTIISIKHQVNKPNRDGRSWRRLVLHITPEFWIFAATPKMAATRAQSTVLNKTL